MGVRVGSLALVAALLCALCANAQRVFGEGGRRAVGGAAGGRARRVALRAAAVRRANGAARTCVGRTQQQCHRRQGRLTPAPSMTSLHAVEQPLDGYSQGWGPRAAPRFGTCSNELRATNVTQFTRSGFRLLELRAYDSPKTGCIEALVQTLQVPSSENPMVVRSGTPGPVVGAFGGG
jgi:hypothetical protein